MAYSVSDYDPVLKDYYTPERIRDLSMQKSPFFGMIKKKKAGGRRYVQPIEFQEPGGGAATFATAQTNQTNSKYEDFLITRAKHYQPVTLENELIEAAMDDKSAFRDAFSEFNRGFKAAGNTIARKIYRTTGGAIGRIDSSTTLSAAVITLTDVADAFNFYIGQKITLSATNGTGTEKDSGDTLVVTNVGYEAGTVTVAENIDTVSGAAHNDFIFTEGDYGLGCAGLESWLPVTDRSTVLAASFFGVTRSQQPERLGGIYMDGTGMSLDEVMIKLSARITKHGGEPDCVFANPEVVSDLMLLWESRKRVAERVTEKITPMIGYTGFEITTGSNVMRVYPDRSCPSNRLYMLTKDTWTIWHAGDMPGFLTKKAGSIIRVKESEDAYEARVGAYFNLGCSAPGYNGVALLA